MGDLFTNMYLFMGLLATTLSVYIIVLITQARKLEGLKKSKDIKIAYVLSYIIFILCVVLDFLLLWYFKS